MQKERDESFRAVVVAPLVERLLLTPEICGSNLNIGKILSTNCAIEINQSKEKEAWNGPSFIKRYKRMKEKICVKERPYENESERVNE